jgi:integrase/recombinase XerD
MNKGNDMFKFSVKLWFEKRNISKTGDVALRLQVIIDRKHKEFPLKLKWKADKIDTVKGILLARAKNDSDVVDYNFLIEAEKAKYNEIFKIYRLKNKNLSIEEFSIQLKIFNEKESFIAYIERERNIRFKRGEIEERTWLNAHAGKLLIIKYDPVSSFKTIDKRWMSGFESFLRKTKKANGESYKASTIWSVIKIAKTYLQRADTDPLINVNEEAANYKNTVPRHIPVFLNSEEVRRLLILRRSGLLTDLQYRVLTAFLFSCFTGLRISDLYRISSNLKIDDDFILFLPFKGRKLGKWLKIPISTIAKEFIHNQKGLYFNIPNPAQFNETLKELAVKAEIKKNLTSHVGRHTFGFLYMTDGGDVFVLKELLGHSKIETTLIYSHIDEEFKKKAVQRLEKNFLDLVWI